MTDYILRKRTEKLSLDRWENEGGRFSADQIDIPDKIAVNKRTGGKNGSQIMREGGLNAV